MKPVEKREAADQIPQRKAAAVLCMDRFAQSEGFKLGEIQEIERDDRVDLVSRAPGGREFGIGYLKA